MEATPITNGFDSAGWCNYLADRHSNGKPELVVLAGGSGVGKGVLIKVLKQLGIFDDKAVVIDPELVIKYAPKLGNGQFLTRHPEEEPQNADHFYKLRNRMVMDCLSHGISVIVDDHCSRLDKMQDLMGEVQKHNQMAAAQPRAYRTIETALLGLFMPKDRYLKRIASKGVGIKDGTNDHEFTLYSNQAFAKNFPELVKLFDTSVLLENEERNVHAAADYVTAAKYIVDNGRLQELEKNERYKEFQRYADETLPAPTYAWSGSKPGGAEKRDREAIKGSGEHSFAERLEPRGKGWKDMAENYLQQKRARETTKEV